MSDISTALDAAELSRQTAVIGRQMVQLAACAGCGSTALEPMPFGNDLAKFDGVDAALLDSDYHLCSGCAMIFARRRQTSNVAGDYYRLFAHLEHRHYAVYPPPERYLRGKRKAAQRLHGQLEGRGLLTSGQTVAHVRCDAGSLQQLLAARDATTVVHGWDYFDTNLRFAGEQGVANLHLLDPAGVSFPDNVEFDLIIANHMLTHSLDPQLELGRMRAALKPGGALFIYNDADHLLRFEPGHQSYLWVPLNNFHKQLLSAHTLKYLVARAGFAVSEIRYDRHYMQMVARADEAAGAKMAEQLAKESAAVAQQMAENFTSWRRVQSSPLRGLRKFVARAGRQRGSRAT